MSDQDSLFNDDQLVDPDKDYFSELVGDGKKYKDPVAAGRALVEKDAHIKTIEQENADLRAEVSKRKAMQELVDQIGTRTNPPPASQQNNQNAQGVAPQVQSQPKVEDVQTLVRDEVAKIATASQQSTNRRKVADVLRSQLGPGFAKSVAEKAAELGVGTQFIDDLAGRSPSAVLSLLGISETPTRAQTPAAGLRANPGTANRGSQKNFAYYDAMRKTNPSQYFSSRNTQEMIAAAADQGDAFYQ